MVKWDLYNENFEKTNEIVNENEEIKTGFYHWSVNCWIINSKHQLLMLKASLNYNLHYPGFWRGINGNVLSGDSITKTAINTIYEKIGLKIEEKELKNLGCEKRDPYNYIFSTFVINKDIDLDNVKLCDTIIQAKWIDLDELYNMIENGEIAWVLISRIEKYIIPLLK